MNAIMKMIRYLSLPLALTITATILFLYAASLPQSMISILQYISYILFSIGMLLGFRFNKSKVFFLCLVLVLSQLLLSFDLSFLSLVKNKSDILSILSLFIPVNILLFSLFRERGIFTIWGNLKFLFIIVQCLLIWIFLEPQNHDLRSMLQHKVINSSIIAHMPVPQLSLLIFLLIFLVLTAKLYFKPTLMDSSLIGIITMSFIGLLLKDKFLGLNIFYAMAGLILILGVVETSYFMAYRDELTGIPGRRALKESMMKLGNRYVIAMVDIDFFKKFNDTYGHAAGDEVLQMTASNLVQMSGGGKVFRFGGEEFTILFPNKAKEEVLPLLEELRKNIAKEKLSYKKKRRINGKETMVTKQLGVTISIGVAEKNERNKTAEAVLLAADKALYKAKKNGRNCVCK